MTFEHITHRLVFASSSMRISEAAQAKHVIAIAEALSVDVADEAEILVPIDSKRKRRKLVASLLAAALLAPAGLAAASDNALPGDALYPVKKVTEKVLVLFDQDIVALHRVEELEAAARDIRTDAQLSERARAALSHLSSDHPLWGRFHASRSNSDSTALPVPDATQSAPTDERGSAAVPIDDDDSSDQPPAMMPEADEGDTPEDDTSSTADPHRSEDDDASADESSSDDSSS